MTELGHTSDAAWDEVRPPNFKTTAAEKSLSVTNPPTVEDDDYRHSVDIAECSIPASPEHFVLRPFTHFLDIDKLLPIKIQCPNGREVQIEYIGSCPAYFTEGAYRDGPPDSALVGETDGGQFYFYLPGDPVNRRWLTTWRIVKEREPPKDLPAKPSEAELSATPVCIDAKPSEAELSATPVCIEYY
jgi:hypothetical protein